MSDSDKMSVISGRSRRSSSSVRSSRSIEAAADVAALKTKLEYVEYEADKRAELEKFEAAKRAELEKFEASKRAELDKLEASKRAELDKLEAKKELAVAEARMKVYETIEQLENSYDDTNLYSNGKPVLKDDIVDKTDRVREFVNNHSNTVTMATENQTHKIDTEKKEIHVNSGNKLDVNAKEFEPVGNKSEQNDKDVSATDVIKTLVDQLTLNRLPVPEPGVFSGNPLLYPSWKGAFEKLIEQRNIAPQERLYYLKRYVGGPAREALEGFFLINTDHAYDEAKALLEERYGNEFIVAAAFREKLDSWPKVNGRDGFGLRKYGDFLTQCQAAMKTINSLKVLNYVKENQAMMSKLPEWLVHRWSRVVIDYKEKHSLFPPFEHFVKFVVKEGKVACDPLLSTAKPRESVPRSQGQGQTWQKGNSVHSQGQRGNGYSLSTQTGEFTEPCPVCRDKRHGIASCGTFKKQNFLERRDTMMKKGLCFRCLGKGHLAKDCPKPMICDVCNKKHPTILHQYRDEETSLKATVNSVETGSGGMCTLVLPVYVSHIENPEKEVLVYALLDTQSDTTFILEKTCRDLAVDGYPVELKLSTMTACDQIVNSSKYKGLVVRGINSDLKIPLPTTYSRDIMPANLSHVPTPEKARNWPHLEHIADELMSLSDIDVGLLIGYNCPRALIPRDIIPPVYEGDPYGERTDLGWSIVGNVSPCVESENDPIGLSHRIITQEIPNSLCVKTDDTQTPQKEICFSVSKSTKESILPIEVAKMMEQDFSEVKPSCALSMEDTAFLKCLSEGIHVVENGHYELPLPFRNPSPQVPDNRTMALQRLERLDARFKRDVKFKDDYCSFMNKLIQNGHAELIPENELQVKNGWYIPHHSVYHDKKPGKIRVVFDCSARFKGVCLNDLLLKGPDLTNDLIGVLCKFRMEKIAIMCDVEQMFYQFRVNPEHRNYLRFLWWNNGQVAEYRMTVHLFGAASSPGCANFALKQVASDGESQYSPDAIQFVRHRFYVDDGLTSVSSVDKAVDLVHESTELCASKGLRLHKFMTNSKKVMASIPVADQAKEMQDLDLLSDPLPIERALGIQWNVELDAFQFRITLIDRPLTRRGVLSTVSSIYDPLGFLAPVVLKGKMILQELCKADCDWDDPLPPELYSDWEKWRNSLFHLDSVKIDRCVKPSDFGEVRTMELHHFADASTEGYGQCSYLRMIDDDERIHCALLMGKSRVTPKKTVTVPRLELTAALVSVRVSTFLKQELDLTDVREVFWTDSRITLGYIKNDGKRFHIYVANRVQQIRDQTTPEQWKHVASEDNPSDVASRGITPDKLQQSNWLTGPKFLWNSECDFVSPEHGDYSDCLIDDPEVKKEKSFSHNVKAEETYDGILKRLEYFSDWHRLKKAVAICMKYRETLKMKVRSTDLVADKGVTVSDLNSAQIQILKLVQLECFAEEMEVMKSLNLNGTLNDKDARKRNKAVKNTSSLYRLDPFLDADGLLRVGGRLRRARLSMDMKHPVILPKNHHITNLIVRYCHEMVKHQGRGMSINEIRSRGFWVINCGSVVSRYISSCVTCRRLRGVVHEPKMADLPEDRTSEAPPFTYSAVDFFGPFYVKEKRSTLKRYGVLFTCMACRAVHVETANSLTTSSFINAFRRFVSLRGPVRQLRSDKGTNFVGAKRELQEALSELDDNVVKQHLSKEDCDFVDFKFNVPSASHMGGSWERQIRTIRNVLSTLLDELGSQLDDELLRTVMCEATAIVNSRPLTVENINDPLSLDPLSANTLLHMKSKVVLPPPGNFLRTDIYSAKRWRRAQYVVNQFWNRWRKEFLQTLQCRQKWNKPQRNMCVGDVVLVKDDNLPRNKWLFGRVTETYPSDDLQVRKVKLAVSDSSCEQQKGRKISYLERPVQKLVLLVEHENTKLM